MESEIIQEGPEADHERELTPADRRENATRVMAQLAAGETIDPRTIDPRTHGAETITLVHQVRKGLSGF